MFGVNDNYMLLGLQSRSACKRLFIIEKVSPIVGSGYAPGWTLLAGVILLAGLIGPVRALPENMQSGDIGYSINLNFPATAPITQSNMIEGGQPASGNVHGEQLEYVIDSGLASASSESTRLRDDSQSGPALAWESGDISRHLDGESQVILLGVPRITLAAMTQSEAIQLASNINAAPTENEDNASIVEEPLVEEVVMSPFATVALAVLALLGLVSVARRNDI